MSWRCTFVRTALLIFSSAAIFLSQDALGDLPDAESYIFTAPMEPDPGIPDTVTVESFTMPLEATSFTLEISLYNDEELAGLTIPITWDSPDFLCDSITFHRSRIGYVNAKFHSIDNINQRLQVSMSVFLQPYFQPGSGRIFIAYFSIDSAAVDQMVRFDSSFYPPDGTFSLTLANNFDIVPQFVRGTVIFGDPPVPIIILNPSDLAFSATQGSGNPPTQSLTISNSGTGSLTWTAINRSRWLNISPASGFGDTIVAVDADISGMPLGAYYDTIIVSDPDALNTPRIAPVTLTVTDTAYGTAIILPDTQNIYWAYVADPPTDTIYIGNLNVFEVNDIDPAGILVNDAVIPEGWTILPSFPGFTGDVMRILVSAEEFILSYGLLYDTTRQEFTVNGLLTNQFKFIARGEAVFVGFQPGDVNNDAEVDINDVLYIIAYIFKDGQPPIPLERGDIDCSGRVDVGDAVTLINFIFKGGPPVGCGK